MEEIHRVDTSLFVQQSYRLSVFRLSGRTCDRGPDLESIRVFLTKKRSILSREFGWHID